MLLFLRNVNCINQFLLGSELDKIVGSSISSARGLLTIEPKTTMEVMILATGKHRKGLKMLEKNPEIEVNKIGSKPNK
jgi:hypothetical protein